MNLYLTARSLIRPKQTRKRFGRTVLRRNTCTSHAHICAQFYFSFVFWIEFCFWIKLSFRSKFCELSLDGSHPSVVLWTVPEEFHYDSTYLNRVHVSLAPLIASHKNGPFSQKQFGNSIKTFMTPQFDIFAISCQLQTIYIIMHLTSNNIVCLVRISQIFWDFYESGKQAPKVWAINRVRFFVTVKLSLDSPSWLRWFTADLANIFLPNFKTQFNHENHVTEEILTMNLKARYSTHHPRQSGRNRTKILIENKVPVGQGLCFILSYPSILLFIQRVPSLLPWSWMSIEDIKQIESVTNQKK